jgi:regulator of nonsense transcripts 1
MLHARHVSTAAINKLEELWQDDPAATLEDVDKPGADDAAQPTLARYEDGYHFQNVLAPLVKLEADYDRKQKDALKQEGVSVRWEMGLNKRAVATFRFKDAAAEDLRLTAGEELLLKFDAATASLHGREWQAQGVIVRLLDGEVGHEVSWGRAPARARGKERRGQALRPPLLCSLPVCRRLLAPF